MRGKTLSVGISTTDNGYPRLSAKSTLSVTVSNVNEPPAFTSSSTVTLKVRENATDGTALNGAVVVEDEDLGDASDNCCQKVTFAFATGANSFFDIDSSTGALTVSNSSTFNYEGLTNSWFFGITASNSDGLKSTTTTKDFGFRFWVWV
jgi:hypothetical protein